MNSSFIDKSNNKCGSFDITITRQYFIKLVFPEPMDLIVNRIVQLSALRVYVTMLTDPVLAKIEKMDIFTVMKVSDTLCGSIILLYHISLINAIMKQRNICI